MSFLLNSFFSVHTSSIWLKHLLQTQSSQLMAIGTTELHSTFGPLLGIAEHRANTFQQLTKYGTLMKLNMGHLLILLLLLLYRLSGRLDLLVNQIKQNTDHDIVEDSELLVFEDKRNFSSILFYTGHQCVCI